MDKTTLALRPKVMVLCLLACPSDAPLVPVAPKARKIKVRSSDKVDGGGKVKVGFGA